MTQTLTTETVKDYYNGAGENYARRILFADGTEITVRLSDGEVTSGSEAFWLAPGSYGAERHFCAGHGSSRVCPYGMHDGIRLCAAAMAALEPVFNIGAESTCRRCGHSIFLRKTSDGIVWDLVFVEYQPTVECIAKAEELGGYGMGDMQHEPGGAAS